MVAVVMKMTKVPNFILLGLVEEACTFPFLSIAAYDECGERVWVVFLDKIYIPFGLFFIMLFPFCIVYYL